MFPVEYCSGAASATEASGTISNADVLGSAADHPDGTTCVLALASPHISVQHPLVIVLTENLMGPNDTLVFDDGIGTCPCFAYEKINWGVLSLPRGLYLFPLAGAALPLVDFFFRFSLSN